MASDETKYLLHFIEEQLKLNSPVFCCLHQKFLTQFREHLSLLRVKRNDCQQAPKDRNISQEQKRGKIILGVLIICLIFQPQKTW